MTLKKDVVINFVLNSAVFYGIGRKLRDHRTGLLLGLIGGLLSSFTVWYLN